MVSKTKEMSKSNTITGIHIKKLSHPLAEIRTRTLNNIISKLDFGFGCDCDPIKKDLVSKLFNWFSFDVVPVPNKVLNLLIRVIRLDDGSYLAAFGKLRFQNELRALRSRLDESWYDVLSNVEQLLSDPNASYPLISDLNVDSDSNKFLKEGTSDCENVDFTAEESNSNSIFTNQSLERTLPFDVTLPCENGTRVCMATEGGIKWLVMPWQPLVTSDKAVLTAVEEALHNTVNTSRILQTCQFIPNVMLQDFPAEVFLQRPAIVTVLHGLLKLNATEVEVSFRSVIPTVLKTLNKLTRSLRFRIYYYCDPCIANKKQKHLARNIENVVYTTSSEDRYSPEGGTLEANYQAYRSAGTSDRSASVTNEADESVLQLQQMLIPTYCIRTLNLAILQLSTRRSSTSPLKNVKYITNLSYELVQLLNMSITPTIWFYTDDTVLKICESLKSLLKLFGDMIDYFGMHQSTDDSRIIYLQLLCIVVKLLTNIVPLELAEYVVPDSLELSISAALMDAAIYLMYPSLHQVLQAYARQFKGQYEVEYVKLFDESRLVIKSMRAAISCLKESSNASPAELLRAMYASKVCLPYHKNLTLIKKMISFLQNLHRYDLSSEDASIAKKLTLSLLAHPDAEIQESTYRECHDLIKSIIGIETNKNRCDVQHIFFLLNPNILTEIICHGASSESENIKIMAEEMLIYMLKGKLQMGKTGWTKFLEALVPVLPLLQCLAHTSANLGQCITKMLDPDVYSDIELPYIEVLKGNARLLFSPHADIREEALCRLIWLLHREKDSTKKLPRLSSLHGLPLNSLCIFDRQSTAKRLEGSYPKSSLLSVLKMLDEPNVESKMRKSALVQISVMLTDPSLHKPFLTKNGLPVVLDIFSKALSKDKHDDYPDSVIPILQILKLVCLTEATVRQDLSTRVEVYFNILRSLFLFPNNECVKIDAAELLALLLYNEFINNFQVQGSVDRSNPSNLSLPRLIVSRMKIPFSCKSHWKTSIHRKHDISVLCSNNPILLAFVRQFWAWEWHHGLGTLWKQLDEIACVEVAETLKVQEIDLTTLRFSSPHYCCQQQLYNIQNSTTHKQVSCAIDYLTMYLKFYKMLEEEQMEDISTLPWEQSLERFLLSNPTNKEDCDLFVDVLNFLHFYISTTRLARNSWLCKLMKNLTKSLADLLRNVETTNQDVHQAILKLARTCSAIEGNREGVENNCKNTWTDFIELVVPNLYYGDQQHFYNLADLDRLLTCLTYLTEKSRWQSNKNLLISLGNALIELIISFHEKAESVSFKGLSITRNSIICLNHLVYQMQEKFDKTTWSEFWYEEGKPLSWLPILWSNRDPLVRASAFQLLGGLTKGRHTASQLLNALTVAPGELCQVLLQTISNREESCIVREQATIAFGNLVSNCNCHSYRYVDSLKPEAILIYVEQSNFYYEVSVLFSNMYVLPTLDSETSEKCSSGSDFLSVVPRTVSYLYDCQVEMNILSSRGSESSEIENLPQLITTPSFTTAICFLLNNLISIGDHEVVRLLFEHSIEKYIFEVFDEIPKDVGDKKNFSLYCDLLEMYTSLCTVLTNCLIHGSEVTTNGCCFSSQNLCVLLKYLNPELFPTGREKLLLLRDKFWTEIFNFLPPLYFTESKHFEPVQSALALCGPELILSTIYACTKGPSTLQMSAIASLTYLLSLDIERATFGQGDEVYLEDFLDTCRVPDREDTSEGQDPGEVNELSLQIANLRCDRIPQQQGRNKGNQKVTKVTLGSTFARVLLHLYQAHGYAGARDQKHLEDKDLIAGALANLLCVSKGARRVALEMNLADTTLTILKKVHDECNNPRLNFCKKERGSNERKENSSLFEINSVFGLLMNFLYANPKAKEIMASRGLADMIHKLWPWISSNNNVLITTLKLLATFTHRCFEAAQSLTVTTQISGARSSKTPNNEAPIHLIVKLLSIEIDKAGQSFANDKLPYALQVLTNSVILHSVRTLISKSNLLQFFSKIHPLAAKGMKPWPVVETYYLKFLEEFTVFVEGRTSVMKTPDNLEILIHLAKCSRVDTKLLALSILDHLAFDPKIGLCLLSSVDFMKLMENSLKHGTEREMEITSTTLWTLIKNNQKGRLMLRSAEFPKIIQEVLGRLTLTTTKSSHDIKKDEPLVASLRYMLEVLSPDG